MTLSELLTQRGRKRFWDDVECWFHDLDSPHSVAKEYVKEHPNFAWVLWVSEVICLSTFVAGSALLYIMLMYAFVTILLFTTAQNVPASVFLGLCVVLVFIYFVKQSLSRLTNQVGYT
jgi:hypothetical protein